MELVSGLHLSGASVCLDDKHFIDCTFKDCQLIYNGGCLIVERTSFVHCRHLLHGPARATVLYLQRFGLTGGDLGKWTELTESVQ